MIQRLVSVGQGSNRGHWREQNEDALRVDPAGLLVVADGMGGHACGEIASAVAADAVVAAVGAGAPLGDALASAHAAVLGAADDGRGAPGMGTTCVACRLGPDRGASDLELAWVGDSRGYRLRDGHLEALTRDHSEVQRLVNQGTLTPAQAARHPGRHMLARALGVGALRRADVDECRLATRPHDRLLLCTDGLTGELEGPRIADVLQGHEDDQAAADALVEAALAAGGHDNVTVIVATVE